MKKFKLKKLEILKGGLVTIVSFGVGMIVGNAVLHTTPEDVGKLSKLLIKAGGLALSGLASSMAAKYTETTIDETVDSVQKAIKEAQDTIDNAAKAKENKEDTEECGE